MKVAVQIEHLDPARGGAETYAALLCRDLVSHGIDVEVQAASWRDPPPGVRMVRVPVRGATRWRRWISFCEGCRRLARAGGADRVLAINRGGGMDVFQPHGGTVAGSQRQNVRRRRGAVARALCRAAYRLGPKAVAARRIDAAMYASGAVPVALSRMVADDMVRVHGVPRDRIRLLYNGVDTERFHPEVLAGLRDEARRAWGLPPEAVVFALVAHNFALKGVDALVRAAERLAPGRDVRFLVAGRGRPGPYLRRARPEARRRFVFTGPVPEVERVYAAADAYVHPTWYDPCSLVVLEAMAGGLPVVTTRFNGAGELVEEGVAGVVLESPADLEGLARALGDLLDGDRRRAMGRAARRIAERHPWSRHFTELRRILLEAGP